MNNPMQLVDHPASGLDDADRVLLAKLIENGRESASTLGTAVGLTRQAITARMERLADEGVILGYTARIDPDRIGLSVRAFVSITLLPACSLDEEGKVIDLLRSNPWVQDCYRVTGQDYFHLRVVAPDLKAIRELVVDLRATGVVQSTTTVLALETMFEKSCVGLIACPSDPLPIPAPEGNPSRSGKG